MAFLVQAMADTTLCSASLLLPSDILRNFVQISSHLATIVANNNIQQPKQRFYRDQNAQLVDHYVSP